MYGVSVEWVTSGVQPRAEPENERLTLAMELLKGLKPEDLERVVAWLCRIYKNDEEEDEAAVYAPTGLAERIMADGVAKGAPEVAYRRCLHDDMPAGEHQAQEDLRCPALIPVRGGGEASYYCPQHQGDVPGEPATIEELEEVRATLQTKPPNASYLRLLNTVLEAQTMRVGSGDGTKQQRRA
jgi:hypothetical protein